ncbi:MAG: hypothetical protein U5L45_14065 [Saprospiraceae bacterium]|nr:hypothetical protein [Saprospiraceae bacterium]
MKDKILMGLCGLVGLAMVVFGLNKFLNFIPLDMPQAAKDMMGHFTAIGWLIPLVAIAEIVGGLLLALPKTRALGAIVLLPIVIGIVAHNLHMGELLKGPSLLFFIVVIWAIIDSKDQYMPMIKS